MIANSEGLLTKYRSYRQTFLLGHSFNGVETRPVLKARAAKGFEMFEVLDPEILRRWF